MDTPRQTIALQKTACFFCLLMAGVIFPHFSLAQIQDNLESEIEEIDQLISNEEFIKAKQKLSEIDALNIRDERIDILNGRLKLFDSIGTSSELNSSSANSTTTLTDQDKTTATDLFDSLRVALENGKLTQIGQLSDPSQSTSALVQALFSNYTNVEVKLSDTSTDTSTQSFFATLEIVKLTTDSGDTAYPADAWKTHELRVMKTQGDWRKVRW